MPANTHVDTSFAFGQVGRYDDQPNTSGGGFGPPLTFSNFRLSGTPVRPQITLISPSVGKPGAAVTIHGSNLQGATEVTFNGVAAQFTQNYPNTDIVAIVPVGATTGPIVVSTPADTAGLFTVLP